MSAPLGYQNQSNQNQYSNSNSNVNGRGYNQDGNGYGSGSGTYGQGYNQLNNSSPTTPHNPSTSHTLNPNPNPFADPLDRSSTDSTRAPLLSAENQHQNPFSDDMAQPLSRSGQNQYPQGGPPGHSRTMSSLQSQESGGGGGGEVGGVQRGELGGGYGPYAYQMPSGVSREPLLPSHAPGASATAPSGPSRFPSNNSESSYDSGYKPIAGHSGGAAPGSKHKHSNSMSKGAVGAGAGGAAAGTTTLLLWDNKDDLDDALHTPDPKGRDTHHWDPFSARGWVNVLAIVILLGALITLFAGWPIIVYYDNKFNRSSGGNTPGFNLGGINSTGQVPQLGNFPTLVDRDTPENVMSRTGFDGNEYTLVFSDEFESDGRTFYPGDDPYWEAVDLHYWPTGDFEWYDPGQVTTKDGKLVIEMREQPTHGLNFRSGMLQSWNKFCFSQSAYIEVSVSLPGNNRVGGFWPGVWTMGNLGRPGYGGTTDGTWPYSYDSCDIGTLPNQTYVNGTGPEAALTTGNTDGTAPLSFLPGQRWSACTCKGEDHPGPNVGVGRGAPEIDIIEAQINVADAIGEVSQSLQTAPFDDYYQFNNASRYVTQYDTSTVHWNTYLGGVYQQAVSSLANVPSTSYTMVSPGTFNTYGFEMYANPNDRDNGYVTWVANGQPSWTMKAGATGANPRVEISARPVPEEPMTIIMNFGMSNNFQTVDFEGLTFPNYMYIDYVRVYQRSDMINVGCDNVAGGYPTADYINRHPELYANRNITVWAEYLETDEGSQMSWPKNRLKDNCT